MRWIKKKICRWLGVERIDDWAIETDDLTPVRSRNDAPNFFDRNPETNFRIYNATGGMILEVGRWDKTRQEWTTNMHIIDENEDHKIDAIARIMTMELMR